MDGVKNATTQVKKGGNMNEQRIYGDITIHDCQGVELTLDKVDKTRWLTFKCRNNDSEGRLTLFFDSQKDEENIIKSLYSELGKLQPKTEWLIG